MSKKRSHRIRVRRVPYADFIAAMMALFLVLWLSVQDTRIREAVENTFRNPNTAVDVESGEAVPNQDKNTTSSTATSTKNRLQFVDNTKVELPPNVTVLLHTRSSAPERETVNLANAYRP